MFAQTFACITFDHRGHGYTRDLPDDPGAAAYAADLAGLHFANPEHLERSLGLDREALRVRLRNHFRDTFLRLLKGA